MIDCVLNCRPAYLVLIGPPFRGVAAHQRGLPRQAQLPSQSSACRGHDLIGPHCSLRALRGVIAVRLLLYKMRRKLGNREFASYRRGDGRAATSARCGPISARRQITRADVMAGHALLAVDRGYATRFLSNEFLTGRLFVTQQRQTGATADSARESAIPELWPLLMQDLETERPRVIIDDAPEYSNFTLDRYPLLLAFVREHYEPAQEMDGLSVYLRQPD